MELNPLSLEYSNIVYPECDKGNYHFGEKVNMICIDEVCDEEKIGCSACMEQNHPDHKIIPLKLLFHQNEEQLQKLNLAENEKQINIQALVDFIDLYK